MNENLYGLIKINNTEWAIATNDGVKFMKLSLEKF